MVWNLDTVDGPAARPLILTLSLIVLAFCGCSCAREEQHAQSQGGPSSEESRASEADPRHEVEIVSSPKTESSESAENNGSEPDGRPNHQSVASSPDEALERANEILRRAEKDAAAGRSGSAAATARDAWELVRRFPEHPGCKRCADDLLRRMRNWAAAANQNAVPDVSKPISVK
jgi:hypothetical protein